MIIVGAAWKMTSLTVETVISIQSRKTRVLCNVFEKSLLRNILQEKWLDINSDYGCSNEDKSDLRETKKIKIEKIR